MGVHININIVKNLFFSAFRTYQHHLGLEDRSHHYVVFLSTGQFDVKNSFTEKTDFDHDKMVYTPLKPLHKRLKYKGRKQQPIYKPTFKSLDYHAPVFQMPKKGVEGRMPCSVVNMMELFIPDSLLDTIVTSSNAYAKINMREDLLQSAIKRQDILRFFAVYFYMGVVRLPYKRDYWSSDLRFWPVHSVTQSMSRDCFEYVWKNIHMVEVESVDEEVDVNENGGDEEDDDKTDDEIESDEDDSDDEEETEAVPRSVHSNDWYSKVGPLMDMLLKVLCLLCVHPGCKLSIDEMMKLFKGRSAQTHRMKKKPIKEGYKFFALCDQSTGFVFDFFPDGRLEKLTIIELVKDLINLLPNREEFDYFIGMDNYFTTEKVLNFLCEEGIGFVGTARARMGWPPAEFRAVEDDRFNTVYTLPSSDGNYLMCRWVDNNVVTMVTNVHKGTEVVQAKRKRPRLTKNKQKQHQTSLGG